MRLLVSNSGTAASAEQELNLWPRIPQMRGQCHCDHYCVIVVDSGHCAVLVIFFFWISICFPRVWCCAHRMRIGFTQMTAYLQNRCIAMHGANSFTNHSFLLDTTLLHFVCFCVLSFKSNKKSILKWNICDWYAKHWVTPLTAPIGAPILTHLQCIISISWLAHLHFPF